MKSTIGVLHPQIFAIGNNYWQFLDISWQFYCKIFGFNLKISDKSLWNQIFPTLVGFSGWFKPVLTKCLTGLGFNRPTLVDGKPVHFDYKYPQKSSDHPWHGPWADIYVAIFLNELQNILNVIKWKLNFADNL